MRALSKYPEETRKYAFDFSAQKEIAAGEALTGTPTMSSVRRSGTGTITIGSASINGTTVEASISGGDVDDRHEVRCIVQTSAANILAAAGILEIARNG